MEVWGAALYGDPCQDCGFRWNVDPSDAVRVVSDIPDRFSHALQASSGEETHPDLAWTPAGYVSHVADNLRNWAERLTGARLGRARRVPGYDPDLLARARHYDDIDLAAALWSLDWAVRCWVESVEAALDAGVTLDHVRRGRQRAEDVARNNAHDAWHHLWDVGRIVAFTEADGQANRDLSG